MYSFTKVHTSLGILALIYSKRGVVRLVLPNVDWGKVSSKDLAGTRAETPTPREIDDVAQALQRHLDGQPQDFSGVPLDTTSVPPFLLRAQRAAQTILPGETRTYGELAALAGAPRAVRAAGRAMATNPWPILVPCHRVFARSSFGNYSAGNGLHTKLRLLWREGYRGRTSNVRFDERDAIAHLCAVDPALGKVIERAGPFTLQATAPRALLHFSDEVILNRLMVGHGVGRWSAELLLLFYLGRPDILPASDLLLRKGFALTYGMRGSPSARIVADAGRAWSPFCSVASYYLWRAVELARFRSLSGDV